MDRLKTDEREFKHLSAEDLLNIFNTLNTSKTPYIKIDDLVDRLYANKQLLGHLHDEFVSPALLKEELKTYDSIGEEKISIAEFHEFIRHREDCLFRAFRQYKSHLKGGLHEGELATHVNGYYGKEFNAEEAKLRIASLYEKHHQSPRLSAQGRRLKYQKISADEIINIFTDMDKNRDGTISADEIMLAARQGKLGVLHHKDACTKFMEAVDKNRDGKISISEFRDFIRKRELVVADLFWRLDKMHTGHITPERLAKVCSKLMGKEMSVDEAKLFIQELDKSHNGDLVLENFMAGTVLTTGKVEDIFQTWSNAAHYLYGDGENSGTSALTNFLSGLTAGCLRCTATAPFDRISIVMRAGGSIHTANNAGILGVAQSLVKTGGIPSLWKGNLIMCGGYGPEGALQMYFMGILKPMIAKDPENPTLTEKFVIGGTSGWMAMSVFYPNYIQQCRMAMSEPGRFSGFMDMVKKTIKIDGPRQALYGGYSACSARRFPEIGINFAVYQVMRERFVEKGKDPSVVQSLLFGATAGLIRCSIVFPLCTVQTKLMVQGESMGRPMAYSGILDCMKKTVYGCDKLGIKAGGIKALYNGWGAYMMKMVPAIGIEMAAIEVCMNSFKPYTG